MKRIVISDPEQYTPDILIKLSEKLSGEGFTVISENELSPMEYALFIKEKRSSDFEKFVVKDHAFEEYSLKDCRMTLNLNRANCFDFSSQKEFLRGSLYNSSLHY